MATYRVHFLTVPGGTEAKVTAEATLDVGRAAMIKVSDYTDLPAGEYSVVVESTEPMAADVNLTASTGSVGSYSAPLANTNKVYFPNVNRKLGPAVWNTPFYVQNAGDVATHSLSVRFYYFSNNASDPNLGVEIVGARITGVSLEPGASYKVDPATVSGLSDNTQYSVVAEADVNLAGAINQTSWDTMQVLSMTGFNSGSSKVYLPNLNTRLGPALWETPIIIQNVGTAATDLEIRYYEFNATGSTPTWIDTKPNLLPGGAYVALPHCPECNSSTTPNTLAQNKGYSAVVTSSGGQPIVAVIQQHGAQGQALNHPGINSGGMQVFYPALYRRVDAMAWETPYMVQNVGDGPTNLEINYYEVGSGALVKTFPVTALPAGVSYIGYIHWDCEGQTGVVAQAQCAPGNWYPGPVDGKIYSAVVTSSSQPIAGMSNNHGTGTSGDLNFGNEALSK